MSKAKKLRELFSNPGFFKIIGAHNGLTAKLVENAGFQGVWASSLEVSASHAVPDANILTMTDYLNAAISMNDAVSIPVVVDVDQGYGNSINVIRMIQKFEAAGIAGVIIEDKKFPKQNSLLASGRQELASISEFVGKIMAAKNAQKNKDFMVMARVEALIAGWGHLEAVKRAKAYTKAGADAIMIHSKKSDPAEIVKFVQEWDENVPLVIVPTNYPSLTEDKIDDLPNIKMVIYANHVIRSAVTSIKKTLQEIKDQKGIHTVSEKLIPVKELFELQGTFEMKDNEKMFVKDKELVSVIIPAAGKNKHISMQNLVAETPICLLDVDGKKILQRNIEIFNSLGLNNINVVAGYLKDKINLPGINKIENDAYETTHILHSIMSASDKMNGKTLIAYSDLLFEKEVVEKLLKSDADITLVVDSSMKTSPFRSEKLEEKDVVLVEATHAPIVGDKVVRPERENHILKIGKRISKDSATHEYVGMALFSEKGMQDFKKAYSEAKEKYQEGEFHEASNFSKANFFHLLQEMINNGYKVNSLEIEKGWMEVHTFEDYKRACQMLSR